MGVVCVNGQFFDEAAPAIPVNDRGFLFGEAAFTTLRVDEGRVEFYESHIRRLRRHAELLDISWCRPRLRWIEELLQANNAQTGLWRLKIIITAGGNNVCMMQPAAPLLRPLKMKIAPWSIVKPTANIKSLAYLDRCWAKREAERMHTDDLIFATTEHVLLESVFANIFWVADGTMYTPDRRLPLLWGVMLQELTTAAKVVGLKVRQVRACLSDIPQTASLYSCNSLIHFLPVIQVDRRRFNRDLRVEGTLLQALKTRLARFSKQL